MACHVDHVLGIFDREGKWLLAEDVLSGAGGGDRLRRMQEVGRQDQDSVNAGILEQGVLVRVSALDPVSRPEVADALGVDVGHRGEPGILHVRNPRVEHALRDGAATDDTDPERAVIHSSSPVRELVHPLMAPAVRPLISRRWNNSAIKTGGSETMMPPVMIIPYLI